MKNGLFLLSILFITNLAAQDIYHSKLSIGVGLFTLQEIDDVASNISIDGTSVPSINLNESQYSPVYYIEFGGYLLDGLLNISASGGYSKFTENYVVTLNNTSDQTTIDNNYYSLMLGTHFYYLKTIHLVELYSGGYVGAYVNRASQDLKGAQIREASEFAYHMTALGIRFGKGIGVHVEAGYGFRGLVNFGLSAQF